MGTVLNVAWSLVLRRQGRTPSLPGALTADGQHLMTDVITSVGVLIGVSLVYLTGKLVLDPAIAALVALQVLWSGWRLMRDSVNGLLDEALPDETLVRLQGR